MFPKISPIIPVRRRDLFESAEWGYVTDLSACIAKELEVKDAVLDGSLRA